DEVAGDDGRRRERNLRGLADRYQPKGGHGSAVALAEGLLRDHHGVYALEKLRAAGLGELDLDGRPFGRRSGRLPGVRLIGFGARVFRLAGSLGGRLGLRIARDRVLAGLFVFGGLAAFGGCLLLSRRLSLAALFAGRVLGPLPLFARLGAERILGGGG